MYYDDEYEHEGCNCKHRERTYDEDDTARQGLLAFWVLTTITNAMVTVLLVNWLIP